MKILINKCYGGIGLSEEFVDHMKSFAGYEEIGIYSDLAREDAFLIDEAIKFGLKRASGVFSKLEVIEIPDGVKYNIGEYDGTEWIEQIWIEATLDELEKGLSREKLNLVSKGADIKLK